MAVDATVWYVTREACMRAADIKYPAYFNTQVDEVIEASSRSIEGVCHRRFYPYDDTRYFDWPDPQYGWPWRLWLDNNELISLTGLGSGQVTIPVNEVNLEPNGFGPPYTYFELQRNYSIAFSGGKTPQRSIEVTGTFGYTNQQEVAGALYTGIDNSQTTLITTNAQLVETGHVLTIGTERLIVTNRDMWDTSQTVLNAAGLAASVKDASVTVTTGSLFFSGETIIIDDERMLILAITGNNLVVRRTWEGTPVNTHATGAKIYVPRLCTVTRAALGTTAAAHSTSAAITRLKIPGLVRELALAESLNELQQRTAGYARQIGTGEYGREARGLSLQDLRDRVWAKYARKNRHRGV